MPNRKMYKRKMSSKKCLLGKMSTGKNVYQEKFPGDKMKKGQNANRARCQQIKMPQIQNGKKAKGNEDEKPHYKITNVFQTRKRKNFDIG